MPVKSFHWRSKSIGEFCEDAEEGYELAGTWIARRSSEEFHEKTVQNTPVDTTTLRESIKEKHVVRLKWGWSGGIYTEIDYAPHVEYGTGLWGPKHAKYKIEPKKPGGVLAFYARMTTPEGKAILGADNNPIEGGLVFARYVMHPGSPGNHMFTIGGAWAEFRLPQIGNEGLRLMRRYAERKIPVPV